jgi:hypothetical protein
MALGASIDLRSGQGDRIEAHGGIYFSDAGTGCEPKYSMLSNRSVASAGPLGAIDGKIRMYTSLLSFKAKPHRSHQPAKLDDRLFKRMVCDDLHHALIVSYERPDMPAMTFSIARPRGNKKRYAGRPREQTLPMHSPKNGRLRCYLREKAGLQRVAIGRSVDKMPLIGRLHQSCAPGMYREHVAVKLCAPANGRAAQRDVCQATLQTAGNASDE